MKEVISVSISEEEIDKRIREVAEEINRDYQGKELHLIGILKGSVMFMCELAKRITVPVTMDFMSCSSYGSGTVSKGIVKVLKDLDHPIEGRDVIVVEDIIDSGNTLAFLLKNLSLQKPKTLKLCTLLNKPDGRVQKDIEVDYTCFMIENNFVVGYGLDFDQKYRNLPYIGVITFED